MPRGAQAIGGFCRAWEHLPEAAWSGPGRKQQRSHPTRKGLPQEAGARPETARPPRLRVCEPEAPAVPGSLCGKDSLLEALQGAGLVLAMSALRQWDPRRPLTIGLNAHREMRKVGQSPDSDSGWSTPRARPVHDSMDSATSTLKSLLVATTWLASPSSLEIQSAWKSQPCSCVNSTVDDC